MEIDVATKAQIVDTAFPKTVDAVPNKDFFVHMLTRDIELGDAILDLLDNCVDGIARSKPNLIGSTPYKGFRADITLNPSLFAIEDNCGGIPLELAETRAFHFGRPPGGNDGIATVGIYGIGMKRAIFKMGFDAKVTSRHRDDSFEVTIDKKWVARQHDWKLPIKKINPGNKPKGTRVEVTALRPEVAKRFDRKRDTFVGDFETFVAQHYSIILAKGLVITINGNPIKAAPLRLLSAEKIPKNGGVITPYVMNGLINGVNATIIVGLYRHIPDEAEIEKEQDERQSKDDAGWTVICNDRVVLYKDRSRLTGWGEAGVPNYHNQFIAISGVVILQSDDVRKLPLTTTKRGIDPSSDTYSVTKDYMREGMRYFTRFTNKWKKFATARDAIYKSSKLMTIDDILSHTTSLAKVTIRASAKGVQSGTKFVPALPEPAVVERDVRISFLRPREIVRGVALRLLDDADAKPNDVGESCFDRVAADLLK